MELREPTPAELLRERRFEKSLDLAEDGAAIDRVTAERAAPQRPEKTRPKDARKTDLSPKQNQLLRQIAVGLAAMEDLDAPQPSPEQIDSYFEKLVTLYLALRTSMTNAGAFAQIQLEAEQAWDEIIARPTAGKKKKKGTRNI